MRVRVRGRDIREGGKGFLVRCGRGGGVGGFH